MVLRNKFSETITAGPTAGEFSVNVVFREISEGAGRYFVADCLEIPGCVSQGNTLEEVRKNIEDAIQLCLSVLFEDCVRQLMARNTERDLRGISAQGRLTINPTPSLRYA